MQKSQLPAAPAVAWLTAEELGVKIRKRSRTIMNAVYAGQEGILIPTSTKLGGRRVWDPVVVAAWIKVQEQRSRQAAATRRLRALKQFKEAK